jgi:uncharacterized membrane protein YbhN (UPF0104 family)
MVALRIAATLLVAVLVVLAARKLDFAALRAALTSARPGWLVLAAVLSFTMLAAKAGYWKTILSPIACVPYARMLWYTISASAASVVVPLRGGEVVRLFWLRTRHGVPLGVLGSVLAFEKVSDITSLALLALPLPWLFPREAWVGRIAIVVPAALVGVFFLARYMRRRFTRAASLRLFDTVRRPLSAYLFVLASWLADATLILVVMRAADQPVSPAAALLVLFAANVAVSIPTTPGNVGALELGVAFALTRVGVPGERAAAFAILYHGGQLATLLAAWSVGALLEALAGARTRARKNEER